MATSTLWVGTGCCRGGGSSFAEAGIRGGVRVSGIGWEKKTTRNNVSGTAMERVTRWCRVVCVVDMRYE